MINKDNVIYLKEGKALPIYFPTPVVCYLHHSIPLSILLTNENSIDWFYSLYTQIRWIPDCRHKFNFYPNNLDSIDSKALDVYTLNNQIFEIENGSITERIMNWINQGYYVACHLAECLIPGLFIKEPLLHPNFIYGYDVKQQVFKIMNFDSNRQFTLIDIPFKVFAEAFESELTKKLLTEEYKLNEGTCTYFIRLYKYDTNFKYTFDSRFTHTQFEEYYLGKNISIHDSALKNVTGDGLWGINVHQGIIEYIEKNKIEEQMLDILAFCGLWEHKNVMMARLQYLEQKGFIDPKNDISTQYSIVELKANDLKTQMFKYNFTQKKSILDKMILNLTDIYNTEKMIFEKIL
jgi:hypothetical protein